MARGQTRRAILSKCTVPLVKDMFNQLTKIGKQLGGDLNKALQLPSRGETWRIGSKAHGHQLDADTILTPASLVGEHDEEKEAILQGVIRTKLPPAALSQLNEIAKRNVCLHRPREGVLPARF